MTLNELKLDIVQFCEQETQKLIAELQNKRFENQGAFNGHAKWVDNDNSPHRFSMSVQKDKGRNQPLVDNGNLQNSLESPSNWNLSPQFNGTNLTLNVPDREQFTEPKYDILDTGGKVNPYISPRGNSINLHYVPARPFKDISAQDMQ